VPEGWYHGSLSAGETVGVGLRSDVAKDVCVTLRSVAKRKRSEGLLDGAVEVLQMIVKRKPESGPDWTALGELLLERAHLDDDSFTNATEAENLKSVLEIALKLDPLDWKPHHNLCRFSLLIRELEDALKACSDAIAIYNADSDLQLSRATALRLLERNEEAARGYEIVELLNPQDASAMYFQGFCWHKAGHVDQAVVAYEKSLDVLKDPEVYEHLGIVLAEAERFKEAIAAFNEAIAMDPYKYKEQYQDIVNELTQMQEMEDVQGVEAQEGSTPRDFDDDL